MSNNQSQSPDFNDAASVTRWYGAQIIDTYSTMGRGQRVKAETRLRVLSTALDTWSKLYRLAGDTAELSALKAELAELRDIINAERGGPRGVVRG